MMRDYRCIAIIPVRKGSRRLPNKNILPFGQDNLLTHKIRQLKLVQEIDDVLVSSDSLEMLNMARHLGCLTHERSEEYSDEKTRSFGEVVEHIALQTPKNSILLWTPCVCPLVDDKDFSQALEIYQHFVLELKAYDSVVSTKIFQEYLWNADYPINYQIGCGHIPSQKLERWNVIINGFCISDRDVMIENKYFFGKKPRFVPISKDKAIDIDDEIDYRIALALASPPPLLQSKRYGKQVETDLCCISNRFGGIRCA